MKNRTMKKISFHLNSSQQPNLPVVDLEEKQPVIGSCNYNFISRIDQI